MITDYHTAYMPHSGQRICYDKKGKDICGMDVASGMVWVVKHYPRPSWDAIAAVQTKLLTLPRDDATQPENANMALYYKATSQLRDEGIEGAMRARRTCMSHELQLMIERRMRSLDYVGSETWYWQPTLKGTQ